MRLLVLLPLWFLVNAARAEPQSALEALRILPKGAAQRLARIEAREGNPAPETWHFLVYEPAAPKGLREFVVSRKKIVTTRDTSQFAETLRAGDVIGAQAIKVDSRVLSGMARRYAAANDARVASFDYEMHKEGEGAAPFWVVTCLDASGDELGALLVGAEDGRIASRTGFPIEPQKQIAAGRKSRGEEPSEEEVRQSDAQALADSEPGSRPAIVPVEDERGGFAAQDGESAAPGEKTQRTITESRRESTTTRGSAGQPSIPRVVRKITSPVRRIVRGLLPF